MSPRPGNDQPLELEMWSVVDKAIDMIPATIDGVDARAMRLCMTLRTASNAIFYDLRESLGAGSDLTNSELNVMLIARLHGEIEFTRITRFTAMKKATASALVNALVARGLLQRRTPETDRRFTLISLTEAGLQQFEAAFAVFNEREQFWTSGLTAAEADTLATLLKKFVDARISESHLGGP